MPPVHLIHWGDPQVEEPEIPEIIGVWKDEGAKFLYNSRQLDNPAPTVLYEELRKAFEDRDCQIVYLSCHGNEEGFFYSRDCSGQGQVTYPQFETWLRSFELDSEENTRWLVLGSCRAMSPAVKLERYLPEWVTLIAGYSGEPSPSDVADLISGFALNLADYGKTIGIAISAAAEATRGKGIDAQFEAMKAAFGTADASFRDCPERHVSTEAKRHLLIVKRRYPSFVWDPAR